MGDFLAEELLAAIRQALASPDAFHRLAERYEQSVHEGLARAENPDLPPEAGER